MAKRTKRPQPAPARTTWAVGILGGAHKDAMKLFHDLDAPWAAHAATTDRVRQLGDFDASRPSKGILGDMAFGVVKAEAFFRIRFSERAYEVDDVCVFFAAMEPSPLDAQRRVIVLALCWWSQRDADKHVSRARDRYEAYVARNR